MRRRRQAKKQAGGDGENKGHWGEKRPGGEPRGEEVRGESVKGAGTVGRRQEKGGETCGLGDAGTEREERRGRGRGKLALGKCREWWGACKVARGRPQHLKCCLVPSASLKAELCSWNLLCIWGAGDFP